MIPDLRENIFAISTAPGTGAVAILRLSGVESHQKVFGIFRSKNLIEKPDHAQMYYGEIFEGEEIVDRVLSVFFHAPKSYTGENMAEIHCHGSAYILDRIMQLLVNTGFRAAEPGEFSLRAFLNGKMDLLQAEAVNDLVFSQNKGSHKMAMKQMRGHFSKRLSELRQELIDLTALFELELDFAEEDVEFANRDKMLSNVISLKEEVDKLAESFKLGNVLKHGIPVAIIGEPNVGKSTLLNKLLGEERAIVSEIPGTTRDSIEDTIHLGQHSFRFIDTAGLRSSTDQIESIGVQRSYEKASQAHLILLLFDATEKNGDLIKAKIEDFKINIKNFEQKKIILVFNKTDLMVEAPSGLKEILEYDCVFISAKRNENLEELKQHLLNNTIGNDPGQDIVVSNVRHYEALKASSKALEQSAEHIRMQLPNDLTASHLREVLHHIGNLTGEISNEEILGNVFSQFCIGK
jgi:tRNA modification GTPase